MGQSKHQLGRCRGLYVSARQRQSRLSPSEIQAIRRARHRKSRSNTSNNARRFIDSILYIGKGSIRHY